MHLETLESTRFGDLEYGSAACRIFSGKAYSRPYCPVVAECRGQLSWRGGDTGRRRLRNPSLTAEGYPVPHLPPGRELQEGFFHEEATALAISKASAGGIMDMGSESQASHQRESHAFKLGADANTNLMSPRTSIPCVKHHLSPGIAEDPDQRKRYLITGDFAIGMSRTPSSDIGGMWKTRPVVSLVTCRGNYIFKVK